MHIRRGNWLRLWDSIVSANDMRCAELLLRHQSALLARFPNAASKCMLAGVIWNAIILCCALGHVEILEILLGEHALDPARGYSPNGHLRAPPIAVLPFRFKRGCNYLTMYAIAFNQHEVIKSLLSRMSIRIYEHDPMASLSLTEFFDSACKAYRQASLESGPFFLLNPQNENGKETAGKRKFSIEINHFMLIQMLDTCAAYGAYECAQLILEKFQSVLPSVLGNRKLSAPDFICFAIQHGRRMIELFQPFDGFCQSALSFEKMDSMFADVSFSLCPNAFAEGVNFLTCKLESMLNLSAPDRHFSDENGCPSNMEMRNGAIPLKLPQILYKLFCPCYMLFCTLFTKNLDRCENVTMTTEDAHEQMPHWRDLHGCSYKYREHSHGSPTRRQHERNMNPFLRPSRTAEEILLEDNDRIECHDLAALLGAMQPLFDFELRNPEIYLLARTSDGHSLRIPPVSLCFCRCYLGALKTLNLFIGTVNHVPSAKLSALSQLILFFLEHLKRFPLNIRNTFYGLLVGTAENEKDERMPKSVHDTNRSIEIIARNFYAPQDAYITDPSFKKLILIFAQIHSAFWISTWQNTRHYSSLWIPQMEMQRLRTGHADPFSVVTAFVGITASIGVSIGPVKYMISDVFAPCLEAVNPINVPDNRLLKSFVLSWRRMFVNAFTDPKMDAHRFALFQVSRRTLLSSTRRTAVSLIEKLASDFSAHDGLGFMEVHDSMQMRAFYLTNETDESQGTILSFQGWHSSLSNIWRAVLRATKNGTLRDICKSASLTRPHYEKAIQEKAVISIPDIDLSQDSIELAEEAVERHERKENSIFQLRDLARQEIWAAVLVTHSAGQSMVENVSLYALLSSLPLHSPLLPYITYE